MTSMEEREYRSRLRDMVNDITDLNESLLDRVKQLKAYINRAGLEVPSPSAGFMAPIVALPEQYERIPSKRLRTGVATTNASQTASHVHFTQESIPWAILEKDNDSHEAQEVSEHSARIENSSHRHPFAQPPDLSSGYEEVGIEETKAGEDEDIEGIRGAENADQNADHDMEQEMEPEGSEDESEGSQNGASEDSSFEEIDKEEYPPLESSSMQPQSDSISLSRIEEDEGANDEQMHDEQMHEEQLHEEYNGEPNPMTEPTELQKDEHEEEDQIPERSVINMSEESEPGTEPKSLDEHEHDHEHENDHNHDHDHENGHENGHDHGNEVQNRDQLDSNRSEAGSLQQVSEPSLVKAGERLPRRDRTIYSEIQSSKVRVVDGAIVSVETPISNSKHAGNQHSSSQASSFRASSPRNASPQKVSPQRVSTSSVSPQKSLTQASLPQRSSPQSLSQGALSQPKSVSPNLQARSSKTRYSLPPKIRSNASMSSQHGVSLTDLVEFAERNGTKEGNLPDATMELILKNERMIQQRFEGLEPPPSLMRSVNRITSSGFSFASQSANALPSSSAANTSAADNTMGRLLPGKLPQETLPSSRPGTNASNGSEKSPAANSHNTSTRSNGASQTNSFRSRDTTKASIDQSQTAPSPLRVGSKSANSTNVSDSSVPNLRAMFESTPAKRSGTSQLIDKSSVSNRSAAARDSVGRLPITASSPAKTAAINANASRPEAGEASTSRLRARTDASIADPSESSRMSIYASALSSFGNNQRSTGNRSVDFQLPETSTQSRTVATGDSSSRRISAGANQSSILKDFSAGSESSASLRKGTDMSGVSDQTPDRRSSTSRSISDSTLTPSFSNIPGAWPRHDGTSLRPIVARPAASSSAASSRNASPRGEPGFKVGLRKKVKTRKVYEVKDLDESLPDMSQLPPPDDVNDTGRRFKYSQ